MVSLSPWDSVCIVSLDLFRIILLTGHARWFAMIRDDSMIRKQGYVLLWSFLELLEQTKLLNKINSRVTTPQVLSSFEWNCFELITNPTHVRAKKSRKVQSKSLVLVQMTF